MKNKYPMHSPSPSPKRENTYKQDPFDYPPSPSPPFWPTPSVSPSPPAIPRTHISFQDYSTTHRNKYTPYTAYTSTDTTYLSPSSAPRDYMSTYSDLYESEQKKLEVVVKIIAGILFMMAIIITMYSAVTHDEDKVKPKKETLNTRPSAFDNKKSMFDN